MITFPGTHNMLKAEMQLNSQGISTRSMPLPSDLGDSCGFCLRLWLEDVTMGLFILKELKIPYGTVYRIIESEQGKYYDVFA
ncbi:MAG: DUF3343 domain-containing protein [Lachnospiraceae bacterium]|nr:DUF3343 domain-containing protein [Lachnospiraceae bacterium]